MANLTNDDIATITKAIAVGFTPPGIALDVADLAKASYKLYQDKTDDNYFEVILCIIGFIPGPGDGVKAGLRIVNRRPEILFELIRFIMTHCKIYGDPEKWLSEIVSDKKIRALIQSGKREALNASNNNIDNKWVKYWINQSIEFTFNFLELSISSLIQLLARKILHWKSKVPKTSANIKGNNTGKGKGNNKTAHGTTYKGKSGENGDGKGSKGRTLSKSDISKVLTNVEVGGVGEHMADYWVASQLGVKVVHDNGQQLADKLQRPMTKLHIGIHDQGIDAIWKSNKKNLGIMNTKAYAIIEAKASLGMGKGKGPGSLLNDLNKQHDDVARRKERETAKKQNRQPKKIIPEQKFLKDQQMSTLWVESRLGKDKRTIIGSGYSRHLLYYNYAHPETIEHLNVLAISISDKQQINHTEHLNKHTPANFWGSAKIDEALNNKVRRANTKNGYIR